MTSANHLSSVIKTLVVFLALLFTTAGIAANVYGDQLRPDFGVYAGGNSQQFGNSLKEILNAGVPKRDVAVFKSLEEAVNSDVDVLILFMLRNANPIPDEIVEKLKQKKAIGIGYGAAQLFGQMGLEINGGACAHFGNNIPSIQVQKSQLLIATWDVKIIAPYDEVTGSDNFGMHIPRYSEIRKFVDVIARAANDVNYAPIVRQNNYVMMGLSASPQAWSDDYQALVRDIAVTLLKRENMPFARATFPTLTPGMHAFSLGKGRSTKEASGKKFYFKFTQPTQFSATLTHAGSNAMMMMFMGQRAKVHAIRKDAKKGEQLTIDCEITAQDLKRLGNSYWVLNITNFDGANTAECVLSVQSNMNAEEEK